MQSLYLTLPGILPGEIYGVPLKGGLPQRLNLNAEPWDVIQIDPSAETLKISRLFSPKKISPNKTLIEISNSLRIGKGQKVIVPAQPASGKSTLLMNLGKELLKTRAARITNLLIDERPEETLAGSNTQNINLSYMRSSKDILIGVLDTFGKVMTRVTEHKTHEVIFIDSLTRLVEVVNSVIQESGVDSPSGTGGISLSARKFVRQILGLGNNFNGGSLTIIATCLVGGSPIEDIIYKDLKGVSNAEIFISTSRMDNPGTVNERLSYVRNQHMIR